MNTNDIDVIIDEAWKQSDNENNIEAIRILEQAIKDFPENKQFILLQLAQIYFKEKEDLKALEAFGMYYNNTKSEEVLNLLLYCYYEPNIEEYKNKYNSNIEELMNYMHFYGEISSFENRKERILWQDADGIICYNNDEIFKMQKDTFDYDLNNKIPMLINEWNIDNILLCEQITKVELNMLTAEIPMYLYYEEHIFSAMLQIVDFQRIIKENRVVIIVGKNQLEEFFNDKQVTFPNYMIGSNVYIDIMQNIYNKSVECFNECNNAVEEYYKNNSSKILENIKNGQPKILFLTSRFTTALQYHTRDCMNVAKEMGFESALLIEKSDIHVLTSNYILDEINKLKPDIIFCIDHFKFEHPFIPTEIVWITWTQDPLQYIMDKNTPSKLSDRDFVLNHMYTWQEFNALNYPKEKLIDAPIPSNPNVYKKYKLSNEEKENYSCDICFVCHAANFEEELEEFLRTVDNSHLRECLEKMVYEYYEIANTTGRLYYSRVEFKEFFLTLISKWGYILDEHILNVFVEEVYMWLNQRIFRQILVNWLIEAGYENIKLWGNGWMEHEKYKKYAMGPAQNGEQLSKIYQASQINVGNNILTTSAARAWESMLSGGFYMSNYIPEEHDISDIRKILKSDEFVMFYDKEDFLSKIRYYLEHEDKRVEMAKVGRKYALERMTFEALMKKTINNIREYYKKED